MALENLRREVASFLKTLDASEQRENQQLTKSEQDDTVRELPVERMKRGEVAPECLRTFDDVAGKQPDYSDSFRYAIPASSDPLQEMFKDSDVEINLRK